ncbi:MAG: hypothetical protein K1X74_06200 [Pirellulales bacterium]|nr:hypothetical protein [Pirellulales bacterium]
MEGASGGIGGRGCNEQQRREQNMEVISQYSRKQAIDDGVLVELPLALVHEAGFKHPTAVTRAVYELCIRVPKACDWQDETGRTWDVLTMLGWSVRRSLDRSEVIFTVLVQNDATGPQQVQLKAVIGPGDAGEPVMTILLPEED